MPYLLANVLPHRLHSDDKRSELTTLGEGEEGFSSLFSDGKYSLINSKFSDFNSISSMFLKYQYQKIKGKNSL